MNLHVLSSSWSKDWGVIGREARRARPVGYSRWIRWLIC